MSEPHGQHHSARDSLILAYEKLAGEGTPLTKISIRSVASEAKCSPSAVSFHFSSMDGLLAVVGKRAYDRLNLARVRLLVDAIEASRPSPPPLRKVLEALIRPAIPSDQFEEAHHRILRQIGQKLAEGSRSKPLAEIDRDMKPHMLVITALHSHAPWLSRAEIGWRVHAILGIRSHVLRRAERAKILCEDQIDLDDPEQVATAIVDLAMPMFAPFDQPFGPTARF
jgi:AcrR family transcriptional regulator